MPERGGAGRGPVTSTTEAQVTYRCRPLIVSATRTLSSLATSEVPQRVTGGAEEDRHEETAEENQDRLEVVGGGEAGTDVAAVDQVRGDQRSEEGDERESPKEDARRVDQPRSTVADHDRPRFCELACRSSQRPAGCPCNK